MGSTGLNFLLRIFFAPVLNLLSYTDFLHVHGYVYKGAFENTK